MAADLAGQAPHIYVALTSGNAESIYAGLEGRKPVGQITDGVQGPLALVTDASGTLYVANSNATITAYARGATSPRTTYTQGRFARGRNGVLCQ